MIKICVIRPIRVLFAPQPIKLRKLRDSTRITHYVLRFKRLNMSKPYDAIIIGGGHNGLTTAAHLAKAGWKVLVLEQRHILGGAAVTEEIYPGFKFTVFSYVVSLLRPE